MESQYTPEELEAMLRAGADHNGTYPIKGAVHLLVFTELIRHRRFVDQLELLEVTGPDGQPTTAAFVRDWTTLLDGPTAHLLGGGATRLLTLAIALATGHPVDLRDNGFIFRQRGFLARADLVRVDLICDGNDEQVDALLRPLHAEEAPA